MRLPLVCAAAPLSVWPRPAAHEAGRGATTVSSALAVSGEVPGLGPAIEWYSLPPQQPTTEAQMGGGTNTDIFSTAPGV